MKLDEICKGVVVLCEEVGAFIAAEGASFSVDKIEHKGLNDLVSYVDRTAEEKLVKRLQELLPEAGFITEEKTINRLADTYNWVIDPLDGTTNFMHGLPVYSISIALQKEGKVVLGVVYEVCQQEAFYAWEAGGAYLNGKAIHVSDKEKLSQSLIATGFPYSNFTSVDAYLSVLKEFMRYCHGVRRLGSAAVDLAYVACGRFDGFYEYNLNAWDVAAGAFIVQEAGGKVSNFSNGEEFIQARQILASNRKVHAEMLNLTKELR